MNGKSLLDECENGNLDNVKKICKEYQITKSIILLNNKVLLTICRYGYVELLEFFHKQMNLTTEDIKKNNNEVIREFSNNYRCFKRYWKSNIYAFCRRRCKFSTL